MTNHKSKTIMLAFSIVMLLIISSVGSFGVSTDNNFTGDTDSGMSCTRMFTQSVSSSDILMKNDELSTLTDSDGLSGIIIANSTENESYSSLVVYGDNALAVYEYQEGNTTNVHLRNTDNYGQTWSSSYSWNPGENISYVDPSLDIVPDSNKAYGTFVSTYNDSGKIYIVSFPKIYQKTGWSRNYIDWSNDGFYNFSQSDIVCYPNTNYPWVAGFIGSTTFEDDGGEGPCVDSPMFCFITPKSPFNTWTIYWEPDFEGCSNLSMDMDYDSITVYGVCEINNGTNQDVLFFYGGPVGWNNNAPLGNMTFTGSEDLTHPQIFVTSDQIFVAMESDDGANKEVILYNSSDGVNWTKKNITADILSPSANPSYPILYANNSHLACGFIESGNLSMTISNDSGINWSSPVQINDQNGTVVEGYHYADFGDMDQMIWTDNRAGNNDIYYYLGYLPSIDLMVTNFTITQDVPLLPTNNWIEFTVENIGDGFAEDVYITISFECDDGNITNTDYPGRITYIGAGETQTVLRPLFKFRNPEYFYAFIQFAGITNLTVNVDPNMEIEDADYGNNVFTKAVSYDDIFPTLWPLEDLFKILKPLI
jgi:hypothetical protein